MTLQRWAKSLLAAFIGGFVNAITLIVVDPLKFNLTDGWRSLLTACTVSALVSAAFYLKQSPVPPDEAPAVDSKINKAALLLALLLPFGILGGCAALDSASTAVTSTTVQTNAVIQNGAQVTAYGFSCWVLSLSKGDDTDLAEKKAILSSVVTYLKLAQTQGFTAASVVNGMVTLLPAKDHWKTFTDAMSDVLVMLSADAVKSALTGFTTGIDAAIAAY
ncbi:MAG: hypothetical protein B9S32_13825 [Verrucomicrobia bacterium Tous-C9LFEB]|nr:MAG: hypothetical protein B9S32_13825 [Verrucomicrobia bacterium Tous-C9LFEB]